MSFQNKTKGMYDIKIKTTDSQSYNDNASNYLAGNTKRSIKQSDSNSLNNVKDESRVQTLLRILSKRIPFSPPHQAPILQQNQHKNDRSNLSFSVNSNLPTSDFEKYSEINQGSSSRSRNKKKSPKNTNSSRSQSKVPKIQDLTLQEKILQNQLRLKHPDYQSLLIQEKEVQLELIDQQAIAKQIKKKIKSKREVLDKCHQNVKKAEQSLIQKKKYLEQFYKHLDKKLKGQNGVPKSLFNKLAQLEKILNEKYLSEEISIKDHQAELKHAHSQYKQRIKILMEAKQKVFKRYSQENSSNKSAQQIKQEHQKFNKQRQNKRRYQQFKKYHQAVQKQQSNKKMLQIDQRVLKKLINIEEEHKKHFLIIQSGIKRQFKILLKDLRYKEMVGIQYQQKIPQLLHFIEQRRKLKEQKQIQIEMKNQQLEQLKTKYNFLIIQYSIIQSEQINRKNNPRHSVI